MFDSCSSGPRVILIHDSYFLAPNQALSVCEVRGCVGTTKFHIALLPLRPGMVGGDDDAEGRRAQTKAETNPRGFMAEKGGTAAAIVRG